MGIDPNRRESFPIDRRSMNGQDGHEDMCSSYERSGRLRVKHFCELSLRQWQTSDPKGNPYQA